MSCTASSLGEMSNGSYSRHDCPPLRIRRHTLRNAGSSHRSTPPPSMCGPSVNILGPGSWMRKRSKYEMGARTLTGVSDTEVCQSERRYFWVPMSAGCVRARSYGLEL